MNACLLDCVRYSNLLKRTTLSTKTILYVFPWVTFVYKLDSTKQSNLSLMGIQGTGEPLMQVEQIQPWKWLGSYKCQGHISVRFIYLCQWWMNTSTSRSYTSPTEIRVKFRHNFTLNEFWDACFTTGLTIVEPTKIFRYALLENDIQHTLSYAIQL